MAVKLNYNDLQFIIRQIKIAEAHASGTPLTQIYVDADGDVVPAGTPGALPAISDPHVPYGLRTVDGSYNNAIEGRESWGAADLPMPRMLNPTEQTDDADGDVMSFGPGAPLLTNTDYGVGGNVADADPRLISNLVADMGFTNPAAIVAALSVAGSQNIYGATGDLAAVQSGYQTLMLALEAADATPESRQAAWVAFDEMLAEKGISQQNGSVVIPNVAPDEGLTAPFSAWMTFFGQFFDHGLDLIPKGGNGTIYIPIAADDPLVTHGPDGIQGSGDELPPELRFMTLTRATPTNGPGADGIIGTADDTTNETANTTTPFVDQNQTYTSHASHQVFLREYATVNGVTVATGRLLDGEAGGLPTWAEVKAQAVQMLGIELTDRDVLNVPLLRTDQYGRFIPDPSTGYAQVIVGLGADGIPNTTDDDVISGTPDTPVSLTAAIRTDHAFLDDIAHNAVPRGFVDDDRNPETPMVEVLPDEDDVAGNAIIPNLFGINTTYDNELLDAHFITGDGRGNENIGLTAVHHVFHSEHNRQIDAQKLEILRSGDLAFINEWLVDDLTALPTLPEAALDQLAFANTLLWEGERLFQGARFATEMQYQHLVFEEFARKVQPNIDAFVFNSVTDIDAAIFAEFAHTVYRFGHSMLTETITTVGTDGSVSEIGLIEAFLNPIAFGEMGLDHDEAAGAIIHGMQMIRGNEIDEFVTGALRNNLLGLPLDLPAINIARGRDTAMPKLNEARDQLYSATSSTFLKPYDNWIEMAANLRNPASIINFIASYGTHSLLQQAGLTSAEKREIATMLVLGGDDPAFNADRLEYLSGTGAWAGVETGLNLVDFWIGGLAEKAMPFGGMLGSTFNAVFEAQLENLQDGDRFYYLTRTQGQNFLNELEQNSFSKMILANTAIADPGPDGIRGTADDIVARHIGVDVFANYDHYLEVDQSMQLEADPEGNDPILEGMGLGKVVRNDPGTAGPDQNYIRFTGGEHVVIGGTEGDDTIIADFGDDGIWGDGGNDRIEAGAGVDLVNGGAGDDIITDSGDSGDFLKGEDGNDVIANSNGLDIIMGGRGKDAIFVGVDSTEVFGGEGDDFILGGDGADFLMGNEGDDWIEAGGGFDTTAGDNSELFFNSSIVGHDVMFAGNDEHDFDAESGDDIMVQGESVMRNEGMFGFDWAIFKGVQRDAYADMRIGIFTTEEQDILRNRFDKTEALSGWNYNDILIGDDRTAAADGEVGVGDVTAANEGIFFNDGLDAAGLARIAGLSNIVSLGTNGLFEAGNVLLGGAGSDILQGNGGDDILDGDRWLNVRISIRNPNDPTEEIATVDTMRHVFTEAEVGGNPLTADWAGRSLFELMIDRAINPGQMEITREIMNAGASMDIDTVVYSDIRANYTISNLGDGAFQVSHTGFGNDPAVAISDGVDTLYNIEVLRFADGDVSLTPPLLELDGFDQTTQTWGDNFSPRSYNNNAGSSNFNGPWVEAGDNGSATSGTIQVTQGGTLTFSTGNVDNASVTRSFDLAGARDATITFSISDANVGFFDNEEIFFDFAADGVNFVTLRTFDGGNGGNISVALPTNVSYSSNAAIRFRANNTLDGGESFSIDNLAINATFFSPANPPSEDISVTFTEDTAPVSIGSDPRITEDSGEIVSARVVLTNAQAGDTLLVPGNLPGAISATTDTSVAGQITVNLAGTESLANYQAAIQAIRFQNTSDTPSTLDRIVQVTVSDGFLDSNTATATIEVVSVNDQPVAGNDRIVTNNVNTAFTIPTWALMANDTDPDGPSLSVSAVSGVTGLAVSRTASTVTVTDTGGAGGSFNYTLTDSIANDVGSVTVVRDTAGTIGGGNGDDILIGNDAANTLDGGTGNDIIFAGGGNDTIIWNSADLFGLPIETSQDGRDFVDGGAGTDDHFIVNGNATNEAYIVYAAANAVAAGFTDLKPGTEIVITRNGGIIAELDNIEEITINTGPGNDSVTTVGDFTPTSLNFNTIRIEGGAGDDTVDVSGLQSAHRIVFRSNGGNDTIIGQLRPQDVVELADGQDISTYSMVENGDGTQRLTNGQHSITFMGAAAPQAGGGSSGSGNGDGTRGAFALTARDLEGLKNLVNGRPAFNGDDDTEDAAGVRELLGRNNNADHAEYGSADEVFIRLTPARYGDYDEATNNRAINPIFAGLEPRTISNVLGTQEADLQPAASGANTFFMAFGQYFDHGLDFLPKNSVNGIIEIGGPGSSRAPGVDNPADLTRGQVYEIDENGVPQHLNKASPFVDQNQAYGSNSLVGQLLRESDGERGCGHAASGRRCRSVQSGLPASADAA